MIKDKLFYKNQRVQEMREFRVGGQSMAEITIVVPRRELTEVANAVELTVKSKDSESKVAITTDGISAELVNKKGVVATKKDEEIYLGAVGSDEFLKACEKNKFNPDQINQALLGSIKTHKGYSFKEI